MFFLRISFHDGVSPPENILVNRPVFSIGTSRFAHLLIEGADVGIRELQVVRGLGNTFICEPVETDNESALEAIDTTYIREANIDLGGVNLYICLIDIDLRWQFGKELQVAPIEIIRKAVSREASAYPALSIQGDVPCFVSMANGEEFSVGRASNAVVRLDAADVSGQHMTVSVDQGVVHVTDAGSTNGTRLNGQFISDQVIVEPKDIIEIGVRHKISALYNPDVEQPVLERSDIRRASTQIRLYPCLYTTSDLIKPTRFVFLRDGVFTIGREPANDIWVGAAHISRRHCEIEKDENDILRIRDISSNGTVLNGVELPRDVWVNLEENQGLNSPVSIDFGSGVVLCLCHDRREEDLVKKRRFDVSDARSWESGDANQKVSNDRPGNSNQSSIVEAKESRLDVNRESDNFSRNYLLNKLKRLPGQDIFRVFAGEDLPTFITRVFALVCFCFLLSFVAYVLYGIVVNL